MNRFIVGCLVVLLWSCDGRKKEISSLVNEWTGKEILFPKQTVFTIQGKDTIEYPMQAGSYKILTYMDTVGCTSCRLKLLSWNSFINEVDSLRNGFVDFYFFLFSQDVKEISHLLRREKFTHPVCVDTNDELNHLNHFPSNEEFRTFLLDKDNKVVVIGNPIYNPAVKALYLEQITGKKKENSQLKTKLTVENKEANLGNVSLSSGGKEAVFVLRNTGEHPLLIMDVTTTCGCTQPEYEKKFILPGKDTKITVQFTPEEEGFFNKVITVHCNAEGSPFRLNLKGHVVK